MHALEMKPPIKHAHSIAAILLALLSVGITVSGSHAQTFSASGHRHDRRAITTRDYWAAFPQNLAEGGGEFIALYLSSADMTTAFVQFSGDTTVRQIPLVPGKSATVSV